MQIEMKLGGKWQLELISQKQRLGSSPTPWRERWRGTAGASGPPVCTLSFPQKKIAAGLIQPACSNKSLVGMLGAVGLQGTAPHRPTGRTIMSWRWSERCNGQLQFLKTAWAYFWCVIEKEKINLKAKTFQKYPPSPYSWKCCKTCSYHKGLLFSFFFFFFFSSFTRKWPQKTFKFKNIINIEMLLWNILA